MPAIWSRSVNAHPGQLDLEPGSRVHEPGAGERSRCADERKNITRAATVGIAVASCLTLACGGDGPTDPSEGAVVTFQVVNETFRVHLLDQRQIDAAHAAANGGRARIPTGRVVAGTGVNRGWSWHLEDVEFAELTTEVCDGRPSDVEREGVTFGAGRFCPWTARIVAIDED